MGLPDDRKSFKIGLAVLIRYRRVTDSHPASQPRRRSIYRAYYVARVTRSSADAGNRRDAFSGQSRPTNIVPFHILGIVSYCAIVTFLSFRLFTIFDFKKCHDLEIGVRSHSMSLKVATFDRLCMVSY